MRIDPAHEIAFTERFASASSQCDWRTAHAVATADHAIVIETLGAIGQIGGDHAVPQVALLMRRRNWLARKKVRALKQASLDALRAIGSPPAEAALLEAATRGDRLLRKLARAPQGPPTHD